jgi:hypothetical protein
VTLDRTWLLGTARAEREALGRTIQYTPPQVWPVESVSPGWRNRDIVAHLASHEVAAAAILGDEVAAEFEEFVKAQDGEPFELDTFNEWTVRRRAEEPFRSVDHPQGPLGGRRDRGELPDPNPGHGMVAPR